MEELQQLKVLAERRAPGALPFIEVYLILLANLETGLGQGIFEDPASIAALSEDFLLYFIVPLKATLEGERPETPWSYFVRASRGLPSQPLLIVLTGMYIHILLDLPRALDRAAGLRPADYRRFNHVIQASVGPSLALLAHQHHSIAARILSRASLPGAALAHHVIKSMRRIAWHRHILGSYAGTSVLSPTAKRPKNSFEYS
ncbi:MAG: hypothetical protein JWN01_119 [Patescibacteria group bacterium]|jgi:hypothetical protein|nr:hypothetical protein [Patescibacteria group bacterium]